MRQAQAIVYETDGRLAQLLEESAAAGGWVVREVRQLAACKSLMQAGGAVLVLKLGRDLQQELSLLVDLTLLVPDAAIIVVGEVDNPALAGLAWELGASFVLFPPLPLELLTETVSHFLQTARRSA